MVALEEIFEVKYGVNLELNKLEQVEEGINFVSRTAKNNGVSAIVRKLPHIKPIEAGMLTVAGGGSVLETFLQSKPFYSGRDLYYLIPKVKLSDTEKLYYCACIRANKYRYSYGRQANRTLKNLLVPSIDEIPTWIEGYDVAQFDRASLPLEKNKIKFDTQNWKEFYYDEIFDIERGESLYLKNLDKGEFPYVSASSNNNGITSKVSIYNQEENCITLAYDGSVGEAFYQPNKFLASEKIVSMRLKQKWNYDLNVNISLFLITLIRLEKYRYNYGLKWSVNSRLLKSKISLPIDLDMNPNWAYMENYIKSLPFSSAI